MGCSQSKAYDDDISRSRDIDNVLQTSRNKKRKEVKMLLLGAGESGKSTLVKQMRLIHEGAFPDGERESYREVIFSNTVQSMRVILEAMEAMEVMLERPENDYHVQTIFMQPLHLEGPQLAPDVTDAISSLWQDKGVQQVFARSREYQLNDSAGYYFDSISRIGAPSYMPSDQDVLRSRVKTTGITENVFHDGGLTYRMVDVGGQRSERKKWIHCFENVAVLIFMASASEYDQMMFEDESVNRMQEALTLFDSICNSRWFVNTGIILFLNKIDILREKLSVSPMRNYFSNYTGGDDFDTACQYILNLFISLNKNSSKQLYTHLTCATDTSQIRFVMSAVNDIILKANLANGGPI